MMKNVTIKSLCALSLALPMLPASTYAEAPTPSVTEAQAKARAKELDHCLFKLWDIQRTQALNPEQKQEQEKQLEELRQRTKELILAGGFKPSSVIPLISMGEVELVSLMILACPDVLKTYYRGSGDASPRAKLALNLFHYMRHSGIIDISPAADECPDYSQYDTPENPYMKDQLDRHYGALERNNASVALLRVLGYRIEDPAKGKIASGAANLGHVILDVEVKRGYTGKYARGECLSLKLNINTRPDNGSVGENMLTTLVIPTFSKNSEHLLAIPDEAVSAGNLVDFSCDWWVDFGALGLHEEHSQYVLADFYERNPSRKPAEGDAYLAEVAQEAAKVKDDEPPAFNPQTDTSGRESLFLSYGVSTPIMEDTYRLLYHAIKTMPHHHLMHVDSYQLMEPKDEQAYYLVNCSNKDEELAIILPQGTKGHDAIAEGRSAFISYQDESLKVVDTRKGAIFVQSATREPSYYQPFEATFKQALQDVQKGRPELEGDVPSLTEPSDALYCAGDSLFKHRLTTLANRMKAFEHFVSFDCEELQLMQPDFSKDDEAEAYVIYKGTRHGRAIQVIVPLNDRRSSTGVMSYELYVPAMKFQGSTSGGDKAFVFFNKDQYEIVNKAQAEECVVVDVRKGAQFGLGQEYQRSIDYLMQHAESFGIELSADKLAIPTK